MKRRGSALVVVVIIIAVIFLMGTIMMEAVIRSSRAVNMTANDIKAYYCAESGINDAVNYICKALDQDYKKNNGKGNAYGQNKFKHLEEVVFSEDNLFGDSYASYNVNGVFDTTKTSYYDKDKDTGNGNGYGHYKKNVVVGLNLTSIGIYKDSQYTITVTVEILQDSTKHGGNHYGWYKNKKGE